MISSLQYALHTNLPYTVTQASVTIPNLPMLLATDLEEAFEFAGIKLLQSQYSYGPLDEIIAARVGLGSGLCSNLDNYKSCLKEEAEMPYRNAVAICFTNASLTVSNLVVHNGHQQARRDFWRQSEFLGLGNPWHLPEREFWDRVSAEIEANAELSKDDIEEIILYGEAAEEKSFLDAVWKALHDLDDKGHLKIRARDLYATIQVSVFSALYSASRGVAEIARRAQGSSGQFVPKVDCGPQSDSSVAVNGEIILEDITMVVDNTEYSVEDEKEFFSRLCYHLTEMLKLLLWKSRGLFQYFLGKVWRAEIDNDV